MADTKMARWRREMLAAVPWIRELRLRERDLCEAYRWSSMPLRAAYDPELREGYRCTHTARWCYRYARQDVAGTGLENAVKHYCTAHVLSEATERENRRLNRWAARHEDLLDEIRERHGFPRVDPDEDP